MISDSLNRLGVYAKAVPGLDCFVKEMAQVDISTLPAGTYFTKEGNIKYMVQEYATSKNAPFEVHAEYIDIHFMVKGKELFRTGEYNDKLPNGFDTKSDFGLVEAEGTNDTLLQENIFVLVFPFEPHAPRTSYQADENVRKVVVKIPY